MREWIKQLDPVFVAIREAIQRNAAAIHNCAEARARDMAALEIRMQAAEKIAMDALAAVDAAHGEVKLMRDLYAIQTRETGEMVRRYIDGHPATLPPAPVVTVENTGGDNGPLA